MNTIRRVFIILLVFIIIALASIIYKKDKASIYDNFPAPTTARKSTEPSFYLYLFFSKTNCHDCLQIIEVLNQLSPPFKVTGLVPGSELKDEALLRNETGALFELKNKKDFKRFEPIYSPAVVGVSENGTIFFVLPAAPGLKDYFGPYLNEFYKKIYPYLLQDKYK
jgi:hypothetical protein